jgi:hypothetical protein
MGFLLKKNNIDEINRAKLMMKYQTSKTLHENLLTINEQTLQDYEGNAERIDPEKEKKELEYQQSISYPNYCPYKEYAVVPPKNELGAEGGEAIPKGWCYYKTPIGGVYIPVSDPEFGSLTEMGFSSIVTISKQVDKVISQGVEPEDSRDMIINRFSKIFPPGSIISFTLDNLFKYTLRLGKKGDKGMWFASAFRDQNGDVLKQPMIVDNRNELQKFQDEWLVWIQLAAAFGTAILSVYIPIGWGVTIELMTELGLGALAAQREFQKGNNVAAASSILIGLLPALKLTKWYRGIDPATFTSLSKKMAGANLNASSTVEDYVKFYNKLNPNQQKLMTQMLEQDRISRDQMLKEIALKLGKPQKAEFMIDGLVNMAKQNPEVLKDLKVFEKLWARELRAGFGIVVLYKIVKSVWGKELNNEQKEAIEWVYTKLPETLKKEYLFNLLSNSESLPEIANNTIEFKKEHIQTGEQAAKNLPPDLLNYLTRETITSSGLEYQEMEQDTSKAVDINDININQSEVDSLETQGWTKKDFVDLDLTKEIKQINGFYYEKQN